VAEQAQHISMKRLKKKYDSIVGNYYVKARLFKGWHTRRYSLALKLAKIVKTNLNILDVGCDGGNFTSSLLKYGDVIGLDLSSSFIDYAHKAYRGVPFLIGDGQHLPLKSESFDLVFCLEVLEHVPNPHSMVIETYRVLKPGGIFITIVPDKDQILWRIIWFFWQRIGRGRSWKDLHIALFNRERLIKLLSPYFHRCVVRWVNYHMLIVIRCEKIAD